MAGRQFRSVLACALFALVAGSLVALAPPASATSLPWVSWVAPNVGPTTAKRVDVYGYNFVHVWSVRFGSSPGTSIRVVSPTHLQVTAPAHAGGVVHVQVHTAAGYSVFHAGDHYTFVPPPTITGVAPASGTTSGGATVTISGSSFRQVRWVMFGAQYGYGLRVLSSTRLQVTAPPGSAGLVSIRVTTAFGRSNAVPADGYTYVASPKITAESPTNGSDNGGTVVELTGTDFSAATAVTFDGVAGSDLVVHSPTDLTVTTPRHVPGYALVNVVTPYGTSSSNGYFYFEYVALRWSGPASVDPRHGSIQAVSCPATTSCVAVDAAGSVVTFNGTTWSAPTNVDPQGRLLAISCSSTNFCAAVDNGGRAVTFSGGVWSTPVQISQWSMQPHSISCASTTFCMAIDDIGQWTTFNGTTWSDPTFLGYDEYSADGSVSCASASFCVAINGAKAITFNGTTWSAPVTVDAGHTLFGLSCPTAAFCAATDFDGNFFTDRNGVWATQGTIDPTTTASVGAIGLTCASASFCVATESNGNAVTFDGTTWSVPTRLENGTVWDVSCAGPSLCVAVDRVTHVFTFDGTNWSAPLSIDPDNGVTGLSCASPTFCIAVDRVGDEVTFDGANWSMPTAIDNSNALTGVSCPTASYCVAVGSDGDVVTFNGAGWSAPTNVDGANVLTSVSCASASLCVAVDGAGNAVTLANGTWSVPAPIDSSGALTVVSCPSASFCMALDKAGHVLTFNGVSWTPPAAVTSIGLSTLSCASSSFCAASDGLDVFTFSAGVWSTPTSADMYGVFGLTCASTSFCVATGGQDVRPSDGGVVTFVDGSWSTPTTVDGDTVLLEVSCTSASSCVSIDNAGRAYVGRGA